VFLSLGATAAGTGGGFPEPKRKERQAARRPSVGSDDTDDDAKEDLGLSLSLRASSSYEDEKLEARHAHDLEGATMVGADGKATGYALLESSKLGVPAAAGGDLAAAGITSQSVNPANRKTRVSVRVRCQGPTVRRMQRHLTDRVLVHDFTAKLMMRRVIPFVCVHADERRVPVEKVRAEGRQGQPVPASLLPVHRRAGMPGAQAGNQIFALPLQRMQS